MYICASSQSANMLSAAAWREAPKGKGD